MHPVVIHKYYEALTAIEFGTPETRPDNFVVFIGGVTDGFLTVPYLPRVAEAVSRNSAGKWAVVQALISSSYLGFGTGSLSRDASELRELVKYLRTTRGSADSKVVFMGHSTGCQDTMEYLVKAPDSDAISSLNGPVSDVEACEHLAAEKLPELLSIAAKLISEGKHNELLPTSCYDLTFGAPTTAYRFHSLYSRGGDDDYFSSYLADSVFEKTFGNVKVPLLVLQGGKDGAIPPWVDMERLMKRWEKFSGDWSSMSTIIPGADHNVGSGSEEGAVDILVDRVVAFIKGI